VNKETPAPGPAESIQLEGDQQPFANLSPQLVIEAVEARGLRTDGRVLALGSYENRVFQVGQEDDAPVVVKFYRPGRWTNAAIEEEHTFSLELAAAEIPVVAPLRFGEQTLFEHGGYRYAVFPRRGGRWPELETADDRQWMGRFLGRLHQVGQSRRFEHRQTLSVQVFGVDARATVLESGFLPDYLEERYARVTEESLTAISSALAAVQPRHVRIHGDCHRGNVLWTDSGPHFVDLDDCMMGPTVQDLWMLFSGSPAEMAVQARDLLEGYEQFAMFDRSELLLVEPLRALRMIHYAAWLARRWHDPAFPRAFPWFAEPRYWENHVAQLLEQAEALQRDPFF
jgi:Ser/Thr protein kinase RdoA (MazF antagonist)